MDGSTDADKMHIRKGTTNVATFDTSGKVGIGTDSPNYKLSVSGNIGLTDGVSTATHTLVGGNYYIQNTGAYSTIFQTAGTERMRIDASGNVGIGTSSVIGNFNLHGGTGDTASQDVVQTFTRISSTGNVLAAKIRLDNLNTNHADLKFQVKTTASSAENDSHYTDALTIQGSSGNVGIGTDSPSTALEVNNASAGATVATFEGTYSSSGDVKLASFERVGGAVAAAVTYADASTSMEFGTTTSHSLSLTTGDTARLTIDNSGNVLVGTTSGGNSSAGFRAYSGGNGAFTIAGTVLSLNRLSSNGEILSFQKDTVNVGSIQARSGDLVIGTGDTGIRFNDSSNAIMPHNATDVVDNQIDIGHTSYRFKDLYLSNNIKAHGDSSPTLDLKDTTNNCNLLAYAQNSTANIGTYSNHALIFDTNSTEAIRIDSSQNLLVGTSDTIGTYPAKLEILGGTGGGRCINTKTAVTTSANAISFNNGNGQIGTIVTNGSATAYNTSSDARLKDVTGEARGLEVINELNPVAYNWKVDGKADEGLIAQEVKELVPNAVTGSEEEMYQMDYSKLVVHLVKAVKEQQTQLSLIHI